MRSCLLCLGTFLLTFCALAATDSGLPLSDEELMLKVHCRDEYLLREPVWVDVWLTNAGAGVTKVMPLNLRWQVLQVILLNSEGDTLKYQGPVYGYSGIPQRNLGAGASHHYFLNLLDCFGEYTYGLEKGLGRFSLNPDAYTLQMRYKARLSNKVTFTVEEPTAQEKKAHDLLKDAYYYDLKLDNQRVIELLEELLLTYPKSRYAALAYFELAGHYGLVGQPEKTHRLLRDLVFHWPNSHFVLKALPGLLRQMPENEKPAFLREVLKKQPETRASELAQKVLDELEEQEKPKE